MTGSAVSVRTEPIANRLYERKKKKKRYREPVLVLVTGKNHV